MVHERPKIPPSDSQSTARGPQMDCKYGKSNAGPTDLVKGMIKMDTRSMVRSRGDKGVGYRPPTIRKPDRLRDPRGPKNSRKKPKGGSYTKSVKISREMVDCGPFSD